MKGAVYFGLLLSIIAATGVHCQTAVPIPVIPGVNPITRDEFDCYLAEVMSPARNFSEICSGVNFDEVNNGTVSYRSL